ncbi:MAG: hypothetical protein ABIP49_08710 [Lysobacterales bacterium]
MTQHPEGPLPGSQVGTCGPTSSVAELNRDCYCVGVDRPALHATLDAVLGAHGLPAAFAQSHPHLFAALPVFVSRHHINGIANVVNAITEVSALPDYRSAVMSWAPEIANFDPGSPGGLLGFDFHLAPDGPRLIEINTNPGGALLNVLLGQAQQACMPALMIPLTDPQEVEQAVFAATLSEWRLQRGEAPLETVAIVDESPVQQYLYPEFVLFQQLFRRHGYRAEICGPEQLARRNGRLWLGENHVDLVYNRLTDFALQQPGHEVLRAAYLAGEVAFSPHPRAHALYADKRNLSLLGCREFLQTSGASAHWIDVLMAAVPPTELVTADNRDSMWNRRRTLFFKPAAGFGSKASYRGDKLTRRVWSEMAAGTYVAQEIVDPSERHLAADSDPLKVDIRCYAYRGEPLLYAARMYRGQTTNFRTPGGGFAPVLTSPL